MAGREARRSGKRAQRWLGPKIYLSPGEDIEIFNGVLRCTRGQASEGELAEFLDERLDVLAGPAVRNYRIVESDHGQDVVGGNGNEQLVGARGLVWTERLLYELQ